MPKPGKRPLRNRRPGFSSSHTDRASAGSEREPKKRLILDRMSRPAYTISTEDDQRSFSPAIGLIQKEMTATVRGGRSFSFAYLRYYGNNRKNHRREDKKLFISNHMHPSFRRGRNDRCTADAPHQGIRLLQSIAYPVFFVNFCTKSLLLEGCGRAQRGRKMDKKVRALFLFIRPAGIPYFFPIFSPAGISSPPTALPAVMTSSRTSISADQTFAMPK